MRYGIGISVLPFIFGNLHFLFKCGNIEALQNSDDMCKGIVVKTYIVIAAARKEERI